MSDGQNAGVRGDAEATLEQVREEYVTAKIDTDPDLSRIVSSDLVREIFEAAWELQFEKDRDSFERRVREILAPHTRAEDESS